MSNNNNNGKQQQDRNFRGPIQIPTVTIENRDSIKPVRAVPKHRQCPLCFSGLGGIGQATGIYRKSATFAKRYYGCDKCGHSWSIDLQPAQILENDE